jgi:putative selenate reductase
MATYFLKPGGYERMTQLAELVDDQSDILALDSVDLEKLAQVAENALENPRYAKEGKSSAPMKINYSLEMLDCFVAPCTVGCPINQDIPEYIRLIGEERYAEAYELIIAKNPLPFITGYICDHDCQLKCVRNDYDDSVLIRDLKRIAAENGFESVLEKIPVGKITQDKKIAVIGAGSAGLSAGYFLAREGFEVTIFDKTDTPGGMVAHGIPGFRIPDLALENDLALIKRAGVKFELNCSPKLDIEGLKKDGFTYIILAIGAWKSRPLNLEGDQEKVRGAIEFLLTYKRDAESLSLGKHVAVIGGGNSAMDSARAALRVPGVESVSILYRRTIKQMPADREELEFAQEDGVIFQELVSPVSLKDGVLTCQRMRLGEKDASGRRRPVALEGELVEYPADTVLAAIGELVEYDLLKANGIEVDERGAIQLNSFNETNLENVYLAGDAYRGPASVVEAIADARKAADGILEKEGIDQRQLTIPKVLLDRGVQNKAIAKKKALITPSLTLEDFDRDYLSETNRCLECNFICNKCVEVCPNRANIAIQVDSPLLQDQNQILHLDPLCNECGNCATFCPYQGAPYKDKFTLFWDEEAFLESENEGYLPLPEAGLRLRYQGEIHELRFANGRIVAADDSLTVDDKLQGLFNIMLAVRDRYSYLLPRE